MIEEAKRNQKKAASFFVFSSLIFSSFIVSFSAQASLVKSQAGESLPKTHLQEKPIFSSKAPVVLDADEMHYDHEKDVVTASGHVVVTQGETIVMADTLSYDRANNQVMARGHVSMLEPSGNVYFADELQLRNDMKTGVVHAVRARLTDDSLFVAGSARKVDENTTEMYNAAYTPCHCDKDKPTPLWQIQAKHATIDQLAQEVRYDDATFALDGVPVFYTPYFSHSTPGAENESGLLVPSFLHSSTLGAELKVPVYYSIAPDRDVMLTPIYTSNAGPVIAGDYRQMFDDGPLSLAGSFTNAPNRDAQGNPVAGHEVRGHIDAEGKFRLSDQYDWGFNVRHTTDDTYMHLYDFSNDTLLTSKIYGEGYNLIGDNHRSYASVEGLAFQGLTGQDVGRQIPVILPLSSFSYETDPGLYNSRFRFDANAMSLYRQEGDESRRLSGTAAWKLPYITPDGQVIRITGQMRDDIYDVNNVALAGGSQFSGVTGREIPQVSALWRYPFISSFGTSNVMLEPVVEFTVSPGGGNPEKIPNEDSKFPEFTDTNLFDADRFSGLDRVENGPRMSYGMRGQAQVFSDKYVDWLLGQHYRVYSDPNFPFSSNPLSHFSDYVGKVGVTSDPFNFAYRFRLDQDTLTANRSEVDAGYNYYPLTANLSYLSLRNDPVLQTKEVIAGNTGLNLTKSWIWVVNGGYDLLLNQINTASTGLTYKNECVIVTTMVGKDYTSLLDIKPSTTVWFRVSLKNLD